MPEPTPYAGSVAIPLPDDTAYRQVAGKAYDPDKTLHVVKMLAGTEDMYGPAIGLIKAVFSAKGVDPKLRQMIILRTAKVLNVPYEWQANVSLSRNNGLTNAEIAAAASDDPVEGIDPDFVLAFRAVDEMAHAGTLTDATLASLLDRYGSVVTRKLVLILGWFSLLSLFLNGCRVPMETTDKIGTMTSPLG